MTQLPLFDGYEPPAREVVEVDGELSAQRRLTIRQAEAIKAGKHPLDGSPLHPAASTTARRGDPKGLPFTCGTCRWRVTLEGWPKCEVGPQSRSTTTDVRAWWPACLRYDEAR